MVIDPRTTLRELYCALEDVQLPPNIPIEIKTLENVLFKGIINDISFLIGGKLIVLVEHQSSINPNMALRFLQYVSEIYKRLNDARALHASKLLHIPRPEFFVLYNGTAPYPDEKTLRLSDAFEDIEELRAQGACGGKCEDCEEGYGLCVSRKAKPALELVVRVLNINEGRNEALAKRCRKLAEYSAFVAKTRFFERQLGDRNEAMKATVQYCTKHDILKEFLEEHAMEVLGMQITEWNLDDAIAVAREEAMEKGIERGMEKGRAEGRLKSSEEIARNALAKGMSLELIQDITGLDIVTLKSLKAGLG